MVKSQGLLNDVLLDWIRDYLGITVRYTLDEEVLGLYDSETHKCKDIISIKCHGFSLEDELITPLNELKRLVYKNFYKSFIFNDMYAVSFSIEKSNISDDIVNLVITRDLSSYDYLALESVICFYIQKTYLSPYNRVYFLSSSVKSLANLKTTYYKEIK